MVIYTRRDDQPLRAKLCFTNFTSSVSFISGSDMHTSTINTTKPIVQQQSALCARYFQRRGSRLGQCLRTVVRLGCNDLYQRSNHEAAIQVCTQSLLGFQGLQGLNEVHDSFTPACYTYPLTDSYRFLIRRNIDHVALALWSADHVLGLLISQNNKPIRRSILITPVILLMIDSTKNREYYLAHSFCSARSFRPYRTEQPAT